MNKLYFSGRETSGRARVHVEAFCLDQLWSNRADGEKQQGPGDTCVHFDSHPAENMYEEIKISKRLI